MAHPSWVTTSGSLGTIPEGKFYRASLEAYDPDFPSDSSKVKYKKISGSLPKGIQVSSNGIIEGTPSAYIQGIPEAVSENVTSKFAVRVYTERNVNGKIVVDRLNDRTFTITVTGQNAPEFVTPAGKLGSYYDGQLVNTQIVFTDEDPGDTATISLLSGELPPGVSINDTGLIYGYITPVTSITGADVGWENEGWDSQPLQFNSGTISKNYSFTLSITDGLDYNVRSFSIFVGFVTADSNAYTIDSGTITTDTFTRCPYIKDYSSDLGTFVHNNFFSHKFIGIDPNNDILNYSVTGTLPSGLTLDTDTGFLHGTLTDIGLTEQTTSFTINVYKQENAVSLTAFDFTITITGNINTGVTWNTNKNLGSINNGEISILNVGATAESGVELLYRLKSGGTYNKLPQGLTLKSSGNIIGKTCFRTFGLIDHNSTCDDNLLADTNLTTADVNGFKNITFDNNTTTIDNKCEFTIEAYSANGQVSTFKTFNVYVKRKNDIPYTELNINSLFDMSARSTINELLNDTTILNPELLYRPDDTYFGASTQVSYTHALGLSPEMTKTYNEALNKSHYDKKLVLGNLKTAQALDNKGNVIYEVVYSEIIDNIKNISPSVSTSSGTLYPNSLDNMRNTVIDKIGQTSALLPQWMSSKQSNGKVLGFIPCWVIAYTLPNQSKLIKYNINNNFAKKLNEIDFVVDRYTLKSQFTQNWDTEDQRWYPTDSTTFDIYDNGVPAVETTFDKRSCAFIGVRTNKADIATKTADTIGISADNGSKGISTTYQVTDKYNKYLMFPKKDIINIK